MSHPSVSPSLLHNTSSSPTVLVASTTPSDKANTMSTSGFDVCRNFQRGSCSYGTRCKFVHEAAKNLWSDLAGVINLEGVIKLRSMEGDKHYEVLG
ncbi:Toll/interleukin-1 receptor domain-containing protein [Tanacetum coccineum]